MNDFRPSLSDELDNCARNETILFDIHSFPREHANIDLCIVDNSGYTNSKSINIPKDIHELMAVLILSGVSCCVLPIYNKFDIITEAREYKIRGLMLEFNEDLPREKILKISRKIINWMNGSYVGFDTCII